MTVTRREMLLGAGGIASSMMMGGSEASMAEVGVPRKLKVMVAGGHPGDLECGCGGTIARYTSIGHEVVLLYLNRGQGFCDVQGEAKDCGMVRTAEAEKACEILHARPIFAGQNDGKAVVDNPHYDELYEQFSKELPDIVLAQWPIDRHRDHRALTSLLLEAWLKSGQKAALYFYEVADDTMMFSPTDFVDITSVISLKHSACYAHASQDPDKWYPKQEEITRFRGTSSGYKQAEGFIKHWESHGGMLPD
jgi:N-acetylglucosamine malate deacetylase 1